MRPGDRFLLGTDLVKDRDRLVAAYDDAAGVTAEFNRNVLHVLNRELGADFVPDRFAHVARWNEAEHRIEMWLRSLDDCRVRVADLDLEVDFAAGRGDADRDQHQVLPGRAAAPSSRRAAWRSRTSWASPGDEFLHDHGRASDDRITAGT